MEPHIRPFRTGSVRWCNPAGVRGTQRVEPLLLVAGHARAEGDAQRAEVSSAARLRCTAEDIRAPGDLEVDEAGGHDRGLELRIQQSAGNSAGPQIYLALRAPRNWPLHQDVRDLHASAKLKHARHFGKGSRFVGYQIEHPVGDDDIRPAVGVGYGERLGVALTEHDVGTAYLGGALPRL